MQKPLCTCETFLQKVYVISKYGYKSFDTHEM